MIIEKHKNIDICCGLKSSVFDCKCTNDFCKATIIDDDLIYKLKILIELIGKFEITSAYRCQRHNLEIGGVICSQHLAGKAIDLAYKTVKELAPLDIIAKAHNVGFTYSKVYPELGTIHLDCR